MKGKRRTMADVFAARTRILDAIDDEVTPLPSSLRQALLDELSDSITSRKDDVVGYYGTPRRRPYRYKGLCR